jgi:hypothetical protein
VPGATLPAHSAVTLFAPSKNHPTIGMISSGKCKRRGLVRPLVTLGGPVTPGVGFSSYHSGNSRLLRLGIIIPADVMIFTSLGQRFRVQKARQPPGRPKFV